MTPLPNVTVESMPLLMRLLTERGVAVRVTADRLQLSDPRGALTDDDRRFLRHCRTALMLWLTAAPDACPGCLDDDPDRRVYRTDASGELLTRCCRCGCTWRWLDRVVVQRGKRRESREATRE